ncbi:type III secretion, HrcV family protein, partial [Chlamydia psittaci 03DC29]
DSPRDSHPAIRKNSDFLICQFLKRTYGSIWRSRRLRWCTSC